MLFILLQEPELKKKACVMSEMLSILDSRAIGDTVAHASHLDFLHSFLSGSLNREGARKEHRQHQGCQRSLKID